MPTPRQPNPNPSTYSNAWSRFFYSWISDLLRKSSKQGTLHLSDLFDLLPHLQSTTLTDKLETNWFDEVKRSKHGEASLIRATLRTMGWKPFLTGLLLIPNELAKFALPLLLTFLMDYFEPCSTMPAWKAWLLALATVFASFSASLIYQQYFYRMTIHGLRMRIAYNGLLYRKVLRLSSQSTNTFGSGRIINLLANDASQVELVTHFIHYIWVAPFQMSFVVYFFWKYIKYVAFIAVGYTLVLLFVQSFFGQAIVFLRTRVLQITDERVKIMSEVIKSMRIVKMYCWESAFNNKIRLVRKREIIQCTFRLMLDCIQTLLSHTYLSVTLLMIYAAMWSLGIPIDTRFFAIAVCMLQYMRLCIVDFFTYAIRNLVYYLAARKRIQAFLLLGESQRDNRLLSTSTSELASNRHAAADQNNIEHTPLQRSTKKSPRVVCNLQRATWETEGQFSLKNIVFDARPGDLICVIGPVGSGKSSLLQTLSGEIAYFDGKVRLQGSFCYVPQESWIFSSSLKANILFGKEYDHKLFQRVVAATALDSDLAQLSHGANTLVGDQGVMLSGGQKARVNMARALYRDADIYLLDDPLSAVDVKVSKHLFEKSIKGYLQNKICILVTHQVQFLQDATKILVLKNGDLVQMGTYAELLASSASFALLLEDIHQHKQEAQQQQSVISTIGSEKEEEEDLSALPTSVETKQEGTVKWRVYISYLRAGVGLVPGVLLIVLVFSAQQAVSIFSSWWLAQWSDEESQRNRVFNNCTNQRAIASNNARSMSDSQWITHRNNRFYMYCVIVLVLILITFFRVVATEFMCLNAGRILHNKMFHRLIRCPISFFDTNPVGRILNRFTKDISIMDDNLPLTLFDFLHCIFQVLGTVALVGSINSWSFIPAALAACGMVSLRYRFARCSRDLKRLEGTTRSPVYSHLASTIHGLKVIRSYRAEHMSSTEFLSHVDDNTRATYLLLTMNRWAAYRFDWIALSFIAGVTLLAMIVRVTRHQFSTADIALTLSYSLNLMGLTQWAIRQSVEVETQMTAVERVLEYCTLDQEPPAQVSPKHRPPTNWPSHGEIVFDNVSMAHSTDAHSPLALRHISLIIRAGEKVGIVGRTGAGKSSLIQTLFRMGSLVEGHIQIDNIDISTAGLDDVRRRISIIPQDPVLFTGTMRNNVDQFGEYSDAEIWHALEQVQLKTLVTDVVSNGLQSVVSEGGSNLSVGQKQLVCLARAILKKSKILVIDEATANVDNATDELIQRAIRDKFKECTVLTIAHRLRTVIDSDRILVLGNGEVLEYDTPQALISSPNSHFASLVHETGVAESEHLRTLANGVSTTEKWRQRTNEMEDEPPPDSSEEDPLLHR